MRASPSCVGPVFVGLPGATGCPTILCPVSPATQSKVEDPSSLRSGLLVDVALVGLLCVGVIAAWSWGAGHSEISGDSFMALDCGFRFGQAGFARPSQPLYGWGLCALSAPLFWGADSMWDVALRRALVGGMIVPLSYLTVRFGLPLWVKASPWPSVSPQSLERWSLLEMKSSVM